ncbi:MAG: fumarate hydratase C-terminal domain-containing protein [Candidatus Diapherotrites archaeon]
MNKPATLHEVPHAALGTLHITSPLAKESAASLRAGQFVSISGTLVTARDRAHEFLLSEKVPAGLGELLHCGILYHCGPIVKKEGGRFRVIAAGPTTSARFGMYAPRLIKRYGISAVMGKGGMGALGVPYLSAIGGAAALLANRVTLVEKVYMLPQFGMPEAIWVLRVDAFPALVTADTHGGSIHEKVIKHSKEIYKEAISDGCENSPRR